MNPGLELAIHWLARRRLSRLTQTAVLRRFNDFL